MNILLPVVLSALFVKALKFLGERNLESEGIYGEGLSFVNSPLPKADI